MKSRRVLLGTVGVDSGQLMVMDPCYVDGEWVRNDNAQAIRVNFWGVDAAITAEWLRKTCPGAQIEQTGRTFYHVTFSHPGFDDYAVLQETIAKEAKAARWRVAAVIVRQGTYDRICAATDSPDHGGGIPYKLGHEGLTVAFSSGVGDGVYCIYATIVDLGHPWGERVAKVEIEMLSDEDINEMIEEATE
jgi:hypothetical protein